MSTRVLFGTMIVGSVAVMVFAGRLRRDPKAATMPAPRAHERPWLTRYASDEVVGVDGVLGSLFADVTLGGPRPSPETRERIAAFARDNHVDINFDIVHHELQAIRFGVTYGGCCGYEAADALGVRLHRPRTYGGTDRRGDWADDWSLVNDEVAVQVHINVNRVELRWEPIVTFDEMLDRAESLVGQTKASVREAAGDHFFEYRESTVLEVPYPFERQLSGLADPRVSGFLLGFDHGRVSDVSITLRHLDDDAPLAATLRARWGRSRVDKEDGTTTWHSHGHTITGRVDAEHADLTIAGP